MQIFRTKIFANRLRKIIRGQRTGSNNHRTFGNLRNFLRNDGNIGVILQFFRNGFGKAFAVNRQTAAGFHPCLIRTSKDQTVATAKLLFQKTYRIFKPITSQGVGTNQLCKVFAVVGRRHLMGLHFDQFYRNATLCQLPRCLRTCQTCADYCNLRHAPASVFFVDFLAVFFLPFVWVSSVFFW